MQYLRYTSCSLCWRRTTPRYEPHIRPAPAVQDSHAFAVPQIGNRSLALRWQWWFACASPQCVGLSLSETPSPNKVSQSADAVVEILLQPGEASRLMPDLSNKHSLNQRAASASLIPAARWNCLISMFRPRYFENLNDVTARFNNRSKHDSVDNDLG